MVLDTVQTIWKGIEGIVATFLTLDNIFYIGVGFTLLMVLFFFVKSIFSYECKLERSVNKLNEWLFKHQTLTESNLMEFNNLIKSRKSPKILRKHWQQYMLYRDKLPSEYISSYNCIDKPAKTSSFTANIKNFIAIYISTAVLTLLLSLITFSGRTESLLTYISMALITPVAIIVLGLIFTLVLRSMQNYNLASLYQTFHIFNRYIDKASATIPKYVDFEILFTKKEIKNGIPILGEYLEKRARQEQEELEEAQRNAVSHEEYDFSKSGVNGSLVLERAMKESETFLNFKQRTLSEIQQFESEISTLKKNYENTSKDYQRKLQASKENMERLRQQQEESTNRIEVNYIRKQQQDEVKKQEQLERDQEDATNKFNTEVNSLSLEIEKRREELEIRKQKVQDAMENEYQSFSEKLHKTISEDVEKVSDEAIQKIANEKDQYAQAITYLKGEVDNKDEIIKAKDQIIAELQLRLANNEYVQDNLTQESVLTEQEPVSEEYQPEEYKPEEYIPEENASNETVESAQEQTDETSQLTGEQEEQTESEQPAQDEETTNSEEIESEETQNITVEEPTEEITNQEVAEEESPSEESTENADGHYDDKGYYWFNDKTYYDANGLYHDLEGNVYDAEGYLQASGQVVEQETTVQNEEVLQEEQPSESQNEVQDEVQDANTEDITKTQEENNSFGTEDINNITLDETEVQPAEEVKEVQPAEEPSVEEQPAKKRGRPRKEKSPEEENKPKRSVGRPRKEKSEDKENKPKRSVGRPRKEKSPEEENKPKRSVGRPKKEKSEDVETKPKRKAGRPKKSESEPHIDILKQLGQSLLEVSEKQAPAKKSAKKRSTKKN